MNNVKMRQAVKRRAAKPGAPRKGTTHARRASRPYHHGNLREKLVDATEALILERGVDGFSLREVARRAGVSPAAPAHHFGDTRGLLTEVAKRGYAEFGDVLEAADARGHDPASRLNEQGIAYVTFALKNPARFALMFRTDKFDATDPDMRVISSRSYRTLETAIRDATGLPAGAPMTGEGFGLLLAVWSIVHGFSHLALGGEMDFAAETYGGRDIILKRFLPLMLKHLPVPAPG